jgi:hypothetical protein
MAGGMTRTTGPLRKVEMPRAPKRAQQADKNLYRSVYLIELARGSSHIASTLSPQTQRIAITEVMDEFRAQYGADKLVVFRELLAESLEKRSEPSAAQAVLNFEPDWLRA